MRKTIFVLVYSSSIGLACSSTSSSSDTPLSDASPDHELVDSLPDTVVEQPTDAIADSADRTKDQSEDQLKDQAPDAPPDVMPDLIADQMPDQSADMEPSAGKHVWSHGFGSSIGHSGNGVAVDNSGNVYAIGTFRSTIDFGGGVLQSDGGKDIYVASFTSSGAHRWSKRYGSAGNDGGFGVATDAAGNIYLTGMFQETVDFGGGPLTADGTDIVVFSLTQDGAFRWQGGFGGPSYDVGGRCVATDSNGNVYVTGGFAWAVDFGGGSLTGVGGSDIFLASFTQDGVHRWSEKIAGPGDGYGNGLTVDDSGMVYLVGNFDESVTVGGTSLSSAGLDDILLASFTDNGTYRWAKRFGAGSWDYGDAVTFDGAGNIYVTGTWMGSVSFGGATLSSLLGDDDIFVASFSKDGDHRWSKGFGAEGMDFSFGIDANASGTIWVTGHFDGPTIDFGGGPISSDGSRDIFVVSLADDGTHLWSNGFGGIGDDRGNYLAVDQADSVYVTGTMFGTVDFGGGPVDTGGSGIYLLKLH